MSISNPRFERCVDATGETSGSYVLLSVFDDDDTVAYLCVTEMEVTEDQDHDLERIEACVELTAAEVRALAETATAAAQILTRNESVRAIEDNLRRAISETVKQGGAEAAIQRVRDLHQPHPTDCSCHARRWDGSCFYAGMCDSCHCGTPCATIRALDQEAAE